MRSPSLLLYLIPFLGGMTSAMARPSRRCEATPPSNPPTTTPPTNSTLKTVVIDGQRLVDARNEYNSGSSSQDLKSAVDAIVKKADGYLGEGPWSVMDKPAAGPNTTSKHDYYSMAPYFWSKDGNGGCPYVRRDGHRNPEADEATDHGAWVNVAKTVPALSVAWFYTGEDKYAKHAAKILKTWFIDEATQMTPHLKHAQAIKCENSGRYIGIIDFAQYMSSILDGVRILEFSEAPDWTAGDSSSFEVWTTEYYDWLSNSDFGKKETGTTNNHGVFADMQRAALALFLGRDDDAKEISEKAKSVRVDSSIEGNGKQPQELERTKSYHYSTYALRAHTRLAQVAAKVDVDLWNYKGSDGQSIFKAVNYLLPAATGETDWPHEELDFSRLEPLSVIHAAADAGSSEALAALEGGKLKPDGTDSWVAWPEI